LSNETQSQDYVYSVASTLHAGSIPNYDPYQHYCYAVVLEQIIQFFEVNYVLHRLVVLQLPVSFLPTRNPQGYGVDQELRVSADAQFLDSQIQGGFYGVNCRLYFTDIVGDASFHGLGCISLRD